MFDLDALSVRSRRAARGGRGHVARQRREARREHRRQPLGRRFSRSPRLSMPGRSPSSRRAARSCSRSSASGRCGLRSTSRRATRAPAKTTATAKSAAATSPTSLSRVSISCSACRPCSRGSSRCRCSRRNAASRRSARSMSLGARARARRARCSRASPTGSSRVSSATPRTAVACSIAGLWRYSRHPNYFGECCVWWGFGCLGLAAGGWWSLVSPLLMTWLLLRVSGVALLEQTIADRRPAYADYVRRTSAFLPLPPRKPSVTRARVDLGGLNMAGNDMISSVRPQRVRRARGVACERVCASRRFQPSRTSTSIASWAAGTCRRAFRHSSSAARTTPSKPIDVTADGTIDTTFTFRRGCVRRRARRVPAARLRERRSRRPSGACSSSGRSRPSIGSSI